MLLLFPEDDEDSDEDSDVDKKKGGRRHHLLRHKLSLGEGESDDGKAAKGGKKDKGKKKSRRKGQSHFCTLQGTKSTLIGLALMCVLSMP